MDMSIDKKRLVSQFGTCEKPRILVVSAPEIVPRHLRLHWKKAMNLASKRNLQALGVWMFK